MDKQDELWDDRKKEMKENMITKLDDNAWQKSSWR